MMRCCIHGTEYVYSPVMEPTHPLKAAREAASLDQDGLATISGVSQATISRIERGQVPGTAVALRLSRALGLSVEALFGHTTDDADASKETDATRAA